MKVSNKAEPVALDASVVSCFASYAASWKRPAQEPTEEEENFLTRANNPEFKLHIEIVLFI